MALLRRKAALKKRYRNRTEGAILKMLAKEKGMTVEQLKAKLEDKVDRQGGTDGTAGTIPPAGSNAKALLNTIRFAKYAHLVRRVIIHGLVDHNMQETYHNILLMR